MRYLKPHFYDQFTCTAGDCPDTCCAGWQIVIDEDSLERYGKEQGEFGKRLRNSIDWEEECFYQNNRRCAFLNDENLCDLYKALGPDALCDTCRLYPRHTEEYEGLRELSLSLSCPEAARIILSCKEPVRFLTEETDEEDDFEEFDFMMFSQLEDTRDVLFKILQNRAMPLQERMMAAEQLAEQYQICMEEQREYDIDDLLRKYDKHLEEGTLSECTAESLAKKGVNAAGFHVWEHQIKELAVLRGLERLRPEWDEVLDGTEKALYQNGESAYQAICEEFHRTFGAKSSRRAKWENIGEQLLMFFVYTYFCGAVYDDMVCSKMELALFSVRWIQEILLARWLENGKSLSMHDIEELSWRYAREVEHSDDNLNALEDWLFETYAPEGCVLEEEQERKKIMQEKQKKWILRIAFYLIGIIVLALGITLNTKTNLGVSPIISMPYSVAQIFGYETGTAVFVAYLIFIVLQIVLLKGKFPPFQLLQVAASYLTSAFITIFDRVLPAPDQMGTRLLVLALAIILTGIGAAVTVDVNIVPNPADGLARVLGERCGKNMGFGKNLFDFSAIVISLAIGMIGAGRPVGIGIGTVVAMVCTGRVIALFNHFGKKKIEEITIA